MEDTGGRSWAWLLVIAGAVGAFLYVAVYDVSRVHRRGPSLSGEELLILARHGHIGRGDQVRCEEHGESFTGSVVGLPGELAVASAAGAQIAKKAQDRYGTPLERLSVNVQVAADPGEILVAETSSLSSTPRPVRVAACLPIVRRVKIAAP